MVKVGWVSAFLWREHGDLRDVSRRALLAVYLLVILFTGSLVSLTATARYDSRVILVCAP